MTESTGKREAQKGKKMIQTDTYLSVKKSESQCIKVMVERFPFVGQDLISPLWAGGDQFYMIWWRKPTLIYIQQLKPAKQKPCTFDQKLITLDGQIDVKIIFGDKTVKCSVC